MKTKDRRPISNQDRMVLKAEKYQKLFRQEVQRNIALKGDLEFVKKGLQGIIKDNRDFLNDPK